MTFLNGLAPTESTMAGAHCFRSILKSGPSPSTFAKATVDKSGKKNELNAPTNRVGWLASAETAPMNQAGH